MDLFAFIICAGTCLIQAPTSGIPRENCLYRMEVALAEDNKQRVMCLSLDPRGEAIDSAGPMRTKGPGAKNPATMLSRSRSADGKENVLTMFFPTVHECENMATRHMAAAMRNGEANSVKIECLPHYTIAPAQ